MPPPPLPLRPSNKSLRRLAYTRLLTDALTKHHSCGSSTTTIEDHSVLDAQLISLGHTEAQIEGLRKPPYAFLSCRDTEGFDLTMLWGVDVIHADCDRRSGAGGEMGDHVGEEVMVRRHGSSSLTQPKLLVDGGLSRDFEAIPLRAEEELRRHRLTTVRKRNVVVDRASDIRARQISSDVKFCPGTVELPAAVVSVVAKVKATKRGDNGFPIRRALRVLSNEHFEQSYGTLRSKSTLMRLFGDTRMFSEEMWRYLYLPGPPK
ncbi:hypothetical protein Slin15195_G128800 [Septoria linicola]|uniref:Uncharacterized protein n=1 Tax=Septoria linicola TaxID=215465 RepID=A0A9Q9BAW1_9PEZI|nr:hypothetical protein Slin15195_G128800 [Septoria linicola]